MSTPTQTPSGAAAPGEEYLPIEDVAERLDLPLGVLIRRVEAGDVPARRTEGPEGARYSVRLSDLGFGPDRDGAKPPEDSAHTASGDGVELVGSPVLPSSWPDKVVPPPAEELAAVSAHTLHEAAAQGSRANGTAAVPKPATAAAHGQLSGDAGLITSPRNEVAGMRLDPRELVAGLLDRWERTLEQRIYAEQRQRFETELNSRQNLLKQLQLELQTARAEHAAAQADKDRRLAERERDIADLQREINSAKESTRKRSWFHRG